MIPFNVSFPGGSRAKITWDSVFWLGVVTAIGTVVGTLLYTYLIVPNLPAPPTPKSSS